MKIDYYEDGEIDDAFRNQLLLTVKEEQVGGWVMATTDEKRILRAVN